MEGCLDGFLRHRLNDWVILKIKKAKHFSNKYLSIWLYIIFRATIDQTIALSIKTLFSNYHSLFFYFLFNYFKPDFQIVGLNIRMILITYMQLEFQQRIFPNLISA
ncbi:hypothetical protein C3K47_04630 [Solitalea longa]|uniref:Uncharacterized protein n=1 Tax=Solitalea longa TaxID=2079460 RepID=A0A2S5A6T9_9SPHI|nr:hypothetical protein C3K47_04630 [Solitalea longa]